VSDYRAIGVELEDGTVVDSGRVVSNVSPSLLCSTPIASEDLDSDFNRSMDGY
jgi:hypothetical protein